MASAAQLLLLGSLAGEPRSHDDEPTDGRQVAADVVGVSAVLFLCCVFLFPLAYNIYRQPAEVRFVQLPPAPPAKPVGAKPVVVEGVLVEGVPVAPVTPRLDVPHSAQGF